MNLQLRGGQLLLGSDGNLTTNEDCCCDETTCCQTHKITAINILLASSGDNCCFDLVGTYIPDSGISGGCEYRFTEEFPEPENPCVPIADVDDPDAPPPPSNCWETNIFGTITRFWIKTIDIFGQLENNDFLGDAKWFVRIEITFYAYSFPAVPDPFSPDPPFCTLRFGFQELFAGGDECASSISELRMGVNSSSDGSSFGIHNSCDTIFTGLTLQVIIDPL